MTTLCSEELLCITPAAQLVTAAHHHFRKYEHYASFNTKKKTLGSFTFRSLYNVVSNTITWKARL